MTRNKIKGFVANLIWLLKKRKRVARTLILCYHSISPSNSFSSATPELFEIHLIWLKKNCHVLPFTQIIPTVSKTYLDEKPVVAITFDDGYADNYDWAFPLLKKYGMTATFFVTVGFVERDPKVLERFKYLRRCNLDELIPLSWEQIEEMHRMGMEIGAHTYSHPNLARLDRKTAKWELERSKQILEDRLGEPVNSLAYPFGKRLRHFTDETVQIAWDVGYSYGAAVAFRAVRKDDDPLTLPRFFVTRDTVETLSQKVYGAWDWLGWWQENVPLRVAKITGSRDFLLK